MKSNRREACSTMGKTVLVLMLLWVVLSIAALVPPPSFRLPIPRTTMRKSLWFIPLARRQRLFSHIIPPEDGPLLLSNMTLRNFIMHPNGVHLAIAPAFFGFFAQFGAMQAWEEALSTSDFDVLQTQIKGLAGCSAGAMTAILIASGISPSVAAEFCRTVTLDKFADPPGIFAIFKGDLFHDIMDSFMKEQNPNATLLLQDSLIPVAVSSFDIRSMKMRILTKGSMPLAARSSACFPFLFEPVKWPGENENESLYLIDGGITDMWGFEGLAAFQSEKPKRVIHIALGNYNGKHGPNSMPGDVSELITISIRNTPSCGPLSMPNGPKATTASRLAMLASMDLPLYRGRQAGHYVLHIDTTDFIPG